MDFYQDLSFSNPQYKTMAEVDPARLAPATTVFNMREDPSEYFVWDLNRKIELWDVGSAKSLLASGKTIALISTGDPREALREALDGDLDIRIIDNFDYDKDRAHRVKITLSLVSLRH